MSDTSSPFPTPVVPPATPSGPFLLTPSENEILADAEAIWRCDTMSKATEHMHNRPAPMFLPNFIGGEFSVPPISASASPILSYQPKTGTVLCQIPRTPPEVVDEAIRQARAAFFPWSTTTRTVRSQYLRRVSDLLQEHRELFAVWESIDQGKTLERARVEVDRAVANFAWV